MQKGNTTQKSNNSKYSKTKLPRFSRLLQHLIGENETGLF